MQKKNKKAFFFFLKCDNTPHELVQFGKSIKKREKNQKSKKKQ